MASAAAADSGQMPTAGADGTQPAVGSELADSPTVKTGPNPDATEAANSGHVPNAEAEGAQPAGGSDLADSPAVKTGPNPDATEESRIAVFKAAQELKSGDKFAAMEHVTTNIHAFHWGVSRAQVKAFVEAVRLKVASGELTNPSKEKAGQFYYDDAKFNDPSIGPNMHLVNMQYIKPCTVEPDPTYGIPFLSYALMVNSRTGGLECQLFVSHAWDEGCFQFGKFIEEAWPEECSGAYICFLSNPQNNSELIGRLCQKPTDSPFYKVLENSPKKVMMLGNSNTPIHRRLWCVYEAFEVVAETIALQRV